MGLKKYIFGSFILILAVFGFVFSIEAGDYRLEVLEQAFVLPVALWLVLPMIALYLLSILHILFYGLKNYFVVKAVSKDTTNMVSLISKKLLNQESYVVFKNKEFEELSKVLKQLDLSFNNTEFSSSYKELNKISEQLKNISDGKYLPTKELKLPNDNLVMIDNLINRVDTDENFALEAIKKSNSYSNKIVEKAIAKVIETKSITTIKKHINDMTLTGNILVLLCQKDSKQKVEFIMSNDEIVKLIEKVELTNTNLIDIYASYKSVMMPEQIIKLFEDISGSNEDYTSAYLYVLAEYEMTDKIRDILVNSATNEFSAHKALIDLKDANKHSYSLDTLCYK